MKGRSAVERVREKGHGGEGARPACVTSLIEKNVCLGGTKRKWYM